MCPFANNVFKAVLHANSRITIRHFLLLEDSGNHIICNKYCLYFESRNVPSSFMEIWSVDRRTGGWLPSCDRWSASLLSQSRKQQWILGASSWEGLCKVRVLNLNSLRTIERNSKRTTKSTKPIGLKLGLGMYFDGTSFWTSQTM